MAHSWAWAWSWEAGFKWVLLERGGEMRELGGKSECLKYRNPLLPELS